jgi:anti-sigma regulatory factor (Ser/Thr protein kinase)
LIGDAQRLRQVLSHIVGNAIKFTLHGEIKVDLSCLQRADHRVQLQCSVADTGVGMTTAQRQKLFQPFSQGDTSTTRQFGGTGLGLVISQQLVVLMDGGIWVESEPGKGSVFVFDAWFGLAPDTRLQPQAVEEPEPIPAAAADGGSGDAGWTPPREAFVRMRALLDDSDADALDLLADISTAGAPLQVQTCLKALERQVSDFNFKDALAALDAIERLIA